MNTADYLNYIVHEIHRTIVATVDDEGLPVTAAIDMMDCAEEPEQIKAFNWSGYHFDAGRSSDTEFAFIRTEIPGK